MTSPPPTAPTAPRNSPRLSFTQRLVRGYVHRELPFWGRLYDAIGGNSEARWRDAGVITMRGKVHGYRMPLDLANWSERLTWFLGRYHDLPLHLALQALVPPGSAFVDIGANLGMVSLLACHLTGPDGLVLACEPNAELGDRLERLAADNEIAHLRVVRSALGSEPSDAVLHEFDHHSGWGSLVAVAPEGSSATASEPVRVEVGDDVLADQLGEFPGDRGLVLKIDVEGYEIPVLRGLRETLASSSPLVLIEAVEENQRRAGFSLEELRAEIEQHGYRGYHLWYETAGIRRKKLTFLPFGQGNAEATDAVFVPSRGPLADRTAALLPR